MTTARAVSVALAIAAGLHLAALPDHVEKGVLIAGFFAISAVLQLTAALMVSAGTSPGARRVIVAGNLSIMGIWVVSRTVGLPFGPEAGVAEPVSTLDSLSLLAEFVAVGGLVMMNRTRRSRAGAWRVGPVAALALTSFFVAGAGMAVATPHHHAEDGASHHEPTPAAEHTEPHAITAAPHSH